MALSVHVLGSGSSGNSTLIASSRTRLLFDVGFSKKETLNRLAQVGCAAESVDALFISHEHCDHIAGLKHFEKEFKVPVFLTEGTREACGGDEAWKTERLVPGQPVQFKDITVLPLAASHDAAQPVVFIIQAEGVRVALLVDLGEVSPSLCRHIRGVDCLVLESNHDVEMLRVGPYPWSLKQRVLGPQGHLSNATVSTFLRTEYDGGAEYIVLAHISQVNNHPEIARLSAEDALRARPQRSLFGSQVRLAPQDRPAEPMLF